MSDMLHGVQKDAHLFQSGLSAASHVMGHTPEAFTGVKLMGDALDLGTGIHDMIEHPSLGAGLATAGGATGMIKDMASLAGAKELAKKLGPLGTGLGVANTVNAFAHGDVEGGLNGAAKTIMGLSGPAGAAAATAYGLGNFAGKKLHHWADGVAAERDYFGGGRGVDQHADDVGGWVEDHVGHGAVGHVLGATAASGAAVADTFYAGGHYLVDEAGDALGSAWDAVRGRSGPGLVSQTVGHIEGQVGMERAKQKYAGDPGALDVYTRAMAPFAHYSE